MLAIIYPKATENDATKPMAASAWICVFSDNFKIKIEAIVTRGSETYNGVKPKIRQPQLYQN